MSETLMTFMRPIALHEEYPDLLAMRLARAYLDLFHKGCVSFTLEGDHASIALLLDALSACRQPLVPVGSPEIVLTVNINLKDELCLTGKKS